MQILCANIRHPQCGEVLAEFISAYCESRLLDISKTWLTSLVAGSEHGSTVASYLLRTNRSEEVISAATALLQKDPDSLVLVKSMLEYTSEGCAEEVALNQLKKVRQKDLVGAAMLASSLLVRNQKYEPVVRGLFAENRKKRYLRNALSLIADTPLGASIAFDLIKLNTNHPEFVNLLCDLIMQGATIEINSFAWDCVMHQSGSDETAQVLRAILYSSGVEVRPEIIDYAISWASKHQEHSNWLSVVQGTLTKASAEQKLTFGHKCLAECPPEFKTAILLRMVEYSGDSLSVQFAKQWLSEFYLDAHDSLVASMVVALLTHSFEYQYLTLAKSLMPKVDSNSAVKLLIALLKAGDPEAVGLSKLWLDTRRIERRWGSVHRNRGELLSKLLTTVPGDAGVREHAALWLVRESEPYEMDLRRSVEKAYEQAGR
jgi:hypothetical protein